ncbi:MAG: hypothetical protein ACYCY0_14050, partial [Acidithiobacillus ferrivorans]
MLGDKPLASYGHENGMLNVAWISGFARNFTRDGDTVSGFIQQTNDVTRMVPVGQSPRHKRTFAAIQNEEAVKITGRVHGRIVTWNNGTKEVTEHSAFLDPLEVSSPSIIEMPSSLTWHTPIKNRKADRIQQDDFQPFGGETFGEGRMRDAANNVVVAGIVDGIRSLRGEGQNVIVGVEIILRQTESPEESIPVRMMNSKLARIIREELRMGRPIMVQGKLRVRDLKAVDADGIETPTGQQVGYVWCRSILNARRGKDILTIPSWVKDIMARYGQAPEGGEPAPEEDAPKAADAPEHAGTAAESSIEDEIASQLASL